MAGGKFDRQTGNVSLRTTRWSLIRRAAAGGPALEEWLSACWYPLYAWARHHDWSPEDSADAVQDFLTKICESGHLGRIDPARGRFRAWLVRSFANHLSSEWKRRTRRSKRINLVPLEADREAAESHYLRDMASVTGSDRVYSKAWALTLMDEALHRLERHFAERGQEEWFQALLPSLEGPLPVGEFEALAARMNSTPAAIRQMVVRFRKRYRQHLLDVASERLGISSEAALTIELRELLGN